MSTLIQELSNMLTEGANSNVEIKLEFAWKHYGTTDYQRGTVIVQCGTPEKAQEFAEECKTTDYMWQLAAELIADEEGIHRGDVKKMKKKDAPEVNVVSHSNGDVVLTFDEFDQQL